MKESLFPALIIAHKKLIVAYEENRQSYNCPLCSASSYDCSNCTYQEYDRCIVPRQRIRHPYFSSIHRLADMDEKHRKAKIQLHKDFLAVYKLWLEKAIDGDETADRLHGVFEDYIKKYT